MGNALRILIVSADFPFPPRWGFARRVYQLAHGLAKRHEVTLLTYALPSDEPNVHRLREEFDVDVVPRRHIPRRTKRIDQAASLVSPRPYSARLVRSAAMQKAIDDLCASRRFDILQLESSVLCGFRIPASVRLVLDEHNIEHEVFRRMREGERSPARRLFYQLEQGRFRRFEERWWCRVHGCAVTSDREVEIVRRQAPSTLTAVVPNGVDLEFFTPKPGHVAPCTLLFNGLLQYRPNLDAAHHLVDTIWPLVAKRCPQARLEIVGRGDPADLRRLERPNVVVTGEVSDMRPYLERAAVVVVPIRMGGGTRLKVVEGLAMGKAMVSTTLGCEGIAVRDGEHLRVADTPQAFAAAVVELFEDPASASELGLAGRALAEEKYSWDLAVDRLESLYRGVFAREAGESPGDASTGGLSTSGLAAC
jgi:glycosyltransferase involved in cell wall biosynthesis